MPSKLRKALGAVKDQTSISLAKVGGADVATLNLEVAILKATSHDEVPLDETYVSEILQLIATNKFYTATCAHAIARRVGRTRNWIVALKSLMLILRIFQEGDPYFPRDVMHIMKRGEKILNLSTFRDHSKRKNPWDYTVYVRSFAQYLDERLDCLLRGKVTVKRKEIRNHKRATEQIVREMKPEVLLEKIAYWQRLLDRAMSAKPTGAAKKNNLVQMSLHEVVEETFILYRDMSEAIALLMDSFFHLPYELGVHTFQSSVRASMQFEELSSYYAFCREIGVGKSSEYPTINKISDEVIQTLREFLKDHASFPNQSMSEQVLVPSSLVGPNRQYDVSESIGEYSEQMDVISEMSYDVGSQCTSLEDLISVTDIGAINVHEQYFQDPPNSSGNDDDDSSSNASSSDRPMNFVSADEWQIESEPNPFGNDPKSGSWVTSKDIELWELGLSLGNDNAQAAPGHAHAALGHAHAASDSAHAASDSAHAAPDSAHAAPGHAHVAPSHTHAAPGHAHAASDNVHVTPCHAHAASSGSVNPFLNEPVFRGASTSQSQPTFGSTDDFNVAPTFRAGPAAPTFHAGKAAWMDHDNDPFAVSFNPRSDRLKEEKKSLEHEQEMWLQHQNKIITKHLTQH